MIQADGKSKYPTIIKRHSIREIARELHHSRRTVKKDLTDVSSRLSRTLHI
jgi:DNA invertase Pin-like site-specific DNA recombinase